MISKWQNFIKKSRKSAEKSHKFHKISKSSTNTFSAGERGHKEKQTTTATGKNTTSSLLTFFLHRRLLWDVRDVEKEGKKIAKESRKEETKHNDEKKKSMWENERRKWQCVVEALFTNWMSMVIFTNKIDALWRKKIM